MVDFTEGSRIQITVADDTVYIAVDGNVLLRAKAPIISVSMTQDRRKTPPQHPEDAP